MFDLFQKLLPRQGRFFEYFEAHGAKISEGAQTIAKLVRGADVAEQVAKIENLEHDADDITRDVLQDVRRIFLTPFDRGSIAALIGVMDDSIDQMQQAAGAVALYDITSFTPEMVGMADLIVEASETLNEALPLLRDVNGNAARLHELTTKLVKLEGEADKLNYQGLRNAFQTHGTKSPTSFVVANEVYRHLEKVCDKFEDVANEIDGLVIDHA